MAVMKLTTCLVLVTTVIMTMMAFAAASKVGGKIHFHDYSEVGEFNIDERPVNGRGNRNHRGRARGHSKHINVPEFEQGIPGEYPIRGPPQAPLILPPGKGVDLVTNEFATSPQSPPKQPHITTNLPTPTVEQTQNDPYANNPFLNKFHTSSAKPVNKQNPSLSYGITNELPTSDKPATTTPSYANPRRIDLFYGSNLLEEEEGQRVNEPSNATEISFADRGLFDTAPHCQSGHILVNNRCRVAV